MQNIDMQSIEIPLAEIRADSLTRAEHNGFKLVVIRSGEQVFAYHDKCPHAFWPLSEGSLNNKTLECPGHGWEFNIETGRCLNAPVYCLTPVNASVQDGMVRLEWS